MTMAKTYKGIKATINGVQYDLNRPGQAAAFEYDMANLRRMDEAELERAHAEEAKRKQIADGLRHGRDLPLAVIDALGIPTDRLQRTYADTQKIRAYLSEDLVAKTTETVNKARAPMTEERAGIVGAAEAAGSDRATVAPQQAPGQPGDSGGWSRSTPPDITPVPTHTQEAGENYLREAAGNKQGTPAPKEQPKFSVGGKTYQKGRYESEASWSLRQNQLQQKYGQQPQAESAVSRGQLPADTLNPAPSAEP